MNEKILVVEDNAKNLYLMKFILQKAGFEVIEANDGQQGVKKAASEMPDLIIMDMQLPIIDGYEATTRIKKYSETKDIPIIALTAYAMRGDREKSIEAGCDEYLKKPIEPESFVHTIQDFLKRYSKREDS